MNQSSLEEEARSLIAKQEEFKEKIHAERSSLLARIAELDELLAKLGGVKKRGPRQKADTEINGGEESVPLDDGEEVEESNQASKTSDGVTTNPVPANWRPNPNLSKTDQILEIVRVKGPQKRFQIIAMFPHASSAEKARTWTPMYQLTRSGRLVENKQGQLTIPNR
jgi:hypothetical protein